MKFKEGRGNEHFKKYLHSGLSTFLFPQLIFSLLMEKTTDVLKYEACKTCLNLFMYWVRRGGKDWGLVLQEYERLALLGEGFKRKRSFGQMLSIIDFIVSFLLPVNLNISPFFSFGFT